MTTYEKDQADIARREVRGARWAVGGVLLIGLALILAIIMTNRSAQAEAPADMTPEQERLVAALALETNDADTIDALCWGLAHDADRMEGMARQLLEDISYEVWVQALAAKCLTLN